MIKNKLYKPGDIILIKKDDDIFAKVPLHFLASNHIGNWEIGEGRVTVGGPLEFLAGEYIVTNTQVDPDGGGNAGHKCICIKVENNPNMKHAGDVEISFYQTGGFCGKIDDPNRKVGDAKLRWEVS